MDTNKMREQFEEAWAYAMRNDEGVPGAKPLRSLVDPERYRGSAVNGAWHWWKLSREAVVVELPKSSGITADGMGAVAACRHAIEAQGLKVEVKP
ncbi:hypothetical protein [Pseudomonas putida]|nr:hypothetical protein [Pseudomonas putida]MCO7515735.1 hypothetical protein [Pseudomonas putida]